MIHVDTLKKIALLLLFLFCVWNWAVAENEVRNLTTVGSSMGRGWKTCMVTLEPQVADLQARIAFYLGLPTAEDKEE